jgi:hypothetical protein
VIFFFSKLHQIQFEFKTELLKILSILSSMEGENAPEVPMRVVSTTGQYFAWSEAKKHTLAKVVSRCLGHKKTDIAMKAKFLMVIAQLKAKPEFEQLEITPVALQTTFKRDREAVLVKYGIDKQEVNLSGLDGTAPSEYERLIIWLKRMPRP